MRRIALILVASLLAAPTLADAAVRLHMPKKHHHRGTAEPADAASAPKSDIPDPVFSSTNTRR